MAKIGTKIKPGDRFLKLGVIQTLWEVTDLLKLKDMPPHLHMREVGGYREMTFGVSAVLDKNLFQRMESSNQTEQVMGRGAEERQDRLHSLFGTTPETIVPARH